MAVRPRRKMHIILVVFLAVLALMGWLIFDSNTRLVTEVYSLGNASLPAEFNGMRIVQLSDLHTAEYGVGNSKLIDAVNNADPDIIVITGDIIDGARAEDYVRNLVTDLVKLAPVYYVTGNHEWASGWIQELFDILTECGVTVLRNEYVILSSGGQEIVLAGVDDPNGPYDMKTPKELVSEIRNEWGDSYILMLSHRNDKLDLWAELGVDAVLCGHAHGGLVRLPFTDGLVAPGQGLFPTYTSGIYTEGGTQMLVSRGLGNTRGLPRLLNNPQIVTVILQRG